MVQSYAGAYYGSSVAAGMLQQPTIIIYIPIVRDISRPEFDGYMDEVAARIYKYNPKQLVSIDRDFLKFLPSDIQEKYKNSYVYLQTNISMCEKIDFLIDSADKKNVPLYILLGTQSISRSADAEVTECVKHEHEIFYINTLQQLKRVVTELQSKDKGYIISALNYVVDGEYNTVVDRGQVNHYINTINRVHTTIGKYSYINLDIALRPRYIQKQIETELYVRPANLKSEDEQILLKNILTSIDGTLSH